MNVKVSRHSMCFFFRIWPAEFAGLLLTITFNPLRRAPASNLPQADTWASEGDLMTSQIGMSRGFEKSLAGGWKESIASNRWGPLYLHIKHTTHIFTVFWSQVKKIPERAPSCPCNLSSCKLYASKYQLNYDIEMILYRYTTLNSVGFINDKK